MMCLHQPFYGLPGARSLVSGWFSGSCTCTILQHPLLMAKVKFVRNSEIVNFRISTKSKIFQKPELPNFRFPTSLETLLQTVGLGFT